MNQAYAIRAGTPFIQNPRVHVFMYSLLLIFTPFILLRNYLVQAISLFSGSTFDILGIEIKIVPVAALLAILIAAFIYRKSITRRLLLAVGIVVLLDTMAQQVTDYYFGHNFYDLQQNWHYIAYGIYAFIIYRDLDRRGLPLYKIMSFTYFSALGLSTFDEFFQKFMSNRVFDICDIGKDLWGALMGMILVYLSGRHSQTLLKGWANLRHKKIQGYYRHPFTLLFFMIALGFIFLNIGSILTETEYALYAAILTLSVFTLFFFAWHISQYGIGKVIILSILIVVLAVQAYFFLKYRRENIVYTTYGLTVYKGIAIPFFDFIVFQDGGIRLVDKKHLFNKRDRNFFLKKKPDIILIGSGSQGLGGKGFDESEHQFIFNQWIRRPTQVIIQKTPEAAETFNRLKKENKKVIFVIHNTC